MAVVKFDPPADKSDKAKVTFKKDKTKDGWELHRPGAAVPSGQLSLEAFSVLADGETAVNGTVMLVRAIAGHAGGQHLAEYLLKNQKLIQVELRGKILVFPDTQWLGGGHLHVPSLYWDGGEWFLYFYCLGRAWLYDDLFVRRCA